MVGVFDAAAPSLDKLHTVSLRTRAPHCRALRAVEHAKLNRRLVGDNAHLSAKSIYFPDYLTFSNATNCRIATHLRNLVHIHSDEQRLRAKIGSSARSLTTGMAGTDNYNVVFKFHCL